MGIWSCIGTNIEAVKESLYQGKSGIGIDPQRLEYGYRSGLTGIVEKPILTKKDLDRHIRAGLSEEAEYAFSEMIHPPNRSLNRLKSWKKSMIQPC